MITTHMHSILDYIIGVALIVAPWLFGFANFETYEAATWVPILVGAFIIVMSMFTSYEISIAKLIPMRLHLILDLIAAFVLALSPWALHYADYVYLPHVLVGAVIIVAVLFTNRSFIEVKKAAISPTLAHH